MVPHPLCNLEDDGLALLVCFSMSAQLLEADIFAFSVYALEMAVPFGFSFGDFVAGIGLIKDLVGALRDSGGSGEQFRAVLSELETLRTALEAIQTLDVDDSLTSERFALHYAASLCQRTILDFREKISKYNTVLRVGGSGSRFKDSYKKVQWALC